MYGAKDRGAERARSLYRSLTKPGSPTCLVLTKCRHTLCRSISPSLPQIKTKSTGPSNLNRGLAQWPKVEKVLFEPKSLLGATRD